MALWFDAPFAVRLVFQGQMVANGVLQVRNKIAYLHRAPLRCQQKVKNIASRIEGRDRDVQFIHSLDPQSKNVPQDLVHAEELVG